MGLHFQRYVHFRLSRYSSILLHWSPWKKVLPTVVWMMTSRTLNPRSSAVLTCIQLLFTFTLSFFYHVYILLAGLFRDKPHVYMLLNHLYSVSCKYTHEQTFSYLHAWLRSADDGEWKRRILVLRLMRGRWWGMKRRILVLWLMRGKLRMKMMCR